MKVSLVMQYSIVAIIILTDIMSSHKLLLNHVIDSIKLTKIGSTVEVKEVDEEEEGAVLGSYSLCERNLI